MHLSPRGLASRLAAVMVAATLSYGTTQAFASARQPTLSPRCDIFACYNTCRAWYGEGTQAYCDSWGDCQCLP